MRETAPMTIDTGVFLRRWLPLGLASVLVTGLVSGCSRATPGVIGLTVTTSGQVNAVLTPCEGHPAHSVEVVDFRDLTHLADFSVEPGSPQVVTVATLTPGDAGPGLPRVVAGQVYLVSSGGYYSAAFGDRVRDLPPGTVTFFAQRDGKDMTVPLADFAREACARHW